MVYAVSGAIQGLSTSMIPQHSVLNDVRPQMHLVTVSVAPGSGIQTLWLDSEHAPYQQYGPAVHTCHWKAVGDTARYAGVLANTDLD